MINIDNAFSVPFGKYNYTKEIYSLQNNFKKCDIYKGNNNFSRVGDSVRTVDNLNTLKDFEYLTQWIEEKAFEFGKHVFSFKKILPIKNMWGTVNTKTSHWNMVHTHPESVLSGVFWLSAPEGSGSFVLLNPTQIDWWTERLNAHDIIVNSHSVSSIEVKPLEGGLLIFPSYVPHMVIPNTTFIKRISISFNIG
tara:strand:+ start:36 stop:617 length:582 start_codon:yes stop_codon:yes gene_type:complete